MTLKADITEFPLMDAPEVGQEDNVAVVALDKRETFLRGGGGGVCQEEEEEEEEEEDIVGPASLLFPFLNDAGRKMDRLFHGPADFLGFVLCLRLCVFVCVCG